LRTLRLLTLHCNKINNDDSNGPKLNKTFLTVENGLLHIFGPETMTDRTDWNVNADVQFNKQAKISFFDEDLIRNLSTTKQFWNYIVKEEYEGNERPKIINFGTNNANYVLTFEII
jgi:hypothetical protein